MLKLGNTEITKLYLGTTEVTKCYLGDVQVFPIASDLFGEWQIIYEENGVVIDSQTINVVFTDEQTYFTQTYTENGYNRIGITWYKEQDYIRVLIPYADGTGTSFLNAKYFDLYEPQTIDPMPYKDRIWNISWEAPKTFRIAWASNASNNWKVEWIPLSGEPTVWEQTLSTAEGQEDITLADFDETYRLIITPATPGQAKFQYNTIGNWTNSSFNVAAGASYSYNGVETWTRFINPCYIQITQTEST